MWAWCSGGCARWYYLNDRQEPLCPVCLSLPTAYTAEDPTAEVTPAGQAPSGVSAHCSRCAWWFGVDDASLDTSFLCPRCLLPAQETRWDGAGGIPQDYRMDIGKD